MCSDTSPRISFSNDLPQICDNPQMQIPRRRDTSLLDSNSDFEFVISHSTNFHQQSSSADELFAYGMILPVQGRKNSDATLKNDEQGANKSPPPLCSLPPSCPKKIEKSSSTKANIVNEEKANIVDEEKANKSFWKFKRSNSLKCDVVNSKKSIMSSFPILSRSHSTGSAQDAKKTKQPRPSGLMGRSSLSSSCSTTAFSTIQKPPVLKKNGGGYGNGMKINPVLNVAPPPYISRFGFGFLLGNGKDKKSKN
ncbi:hypothetical protein ACFE04_008938 [Oxalis oulophora]